MREHIIQAVLYQDYSSRWESVQVIARLNVHQKTRQVVKVKLGDFLLSDDEWILVSFESVKDCECEHINPIPMEKTDDGFRLPIPTLVHNTPGEWIMQFSLVTDYNPITGEYATSMPFDILRFMEYSSIMDDGLTVPTPCEMKNLYNEAINAKEKAIEAATKTQEQLQSVAEGLLVSNIELIEVLSEGYKYKLLLSNGSEIIMIAPRAKIEVEWWI